jgi:hypothetical protein
MGAQSGGQYYFRFGISAPWPGSLTNHHGIARVRPFR